MYTPAEVGKIFNLSRTQIMNLCRELGLTITKIGNTNALTNSDIEQIRFRLLRRYNLEYLLDNNKGDETK